jgi:hypothetical protein
MGSLVFHALPGKLGRCTKEATDALRRHNLGEFLGDFTTENELLELWKAQVTTAIVSMHELGLIIGSNELVVFSFL